MIVLSFDQSYSNIGYSVQEDGELKDYGSYRIDSFLDKVIKRAFIKGLARGLVLTHSPDFVIIEQIRMFNKGFAKLGPITDLAEIISTIGDAIYPLDFYSVDSRSWKAKVVGKASADKEDSVNWVKDKYQIEVDHDTADAICMSLYPMCKKPILNVI